MASNQKLGGGVVVVSANADKMAAGLDRAKDRVKKFGKDTNDVWDKIGEKFGGGGGGFIAKALGAGFFGGIAGSLAIKAMNFIADGLSDVFSQTSKWTQELGRANFQAMLLEKTFDRTLKARDEWTEVADPADKKRRLGLDAGDALTGRNRAMEEVERLRRRMETINSFGLTNTGLALSGDLSREKAFGEAELARAEKEAAKYADRLAEVEDKTKKLNPALNPAIKAGLNDYIAELAAQMDALGKSADDAKFAMLMARGGGAEKLDEAARKFAEFNDAKATQSAKEYADELERVFDALQKGAKSAERLKVEEHAAKDISVEHGDAVKRMTATLEHIEFNRVNQPARELLKTLEMQRMTMGWTANEAKLLELRMAGTDAKLMEKLALEAAFADVMANKAEPLRAPEMKLAGAMLAGSSDAYSLEMKHKFGRGGEGGDPNKGMTLWDVVQAAIQSKVILDKIEKKLKPAGVV